MLSLDFYLATLLGDNVVVVWGKLGIIVLESKGKRLVCVLVLVLVLVGEGLVGVGLVGVGYCEGLYLLNEVCG